MIVLDFFSGCYQDVLNLLVCKSIISGRLVSFVVGIKICSIELFIVFHFGVSKTGIQRLF